MQSHEEFAFITAVSKLQISPALLKDLRKDLASKKKKKRKLISTGGYGTALRPSRLIEVK
jgi:hypothetical protein